MFQQPTKLSAVERAFPSNVAHLMPKYEDIPDEFKQQVNPYVQFQRKWFFHGLQPEEVLQAREGINIRDAYSHLGAIQGSFEPSHEHKQAAVAYLASLWLKLEK